MQSHPLNKVVFIQKVAAFIKTDTFKGLIRLAYVNESWNDTIKNNSFHIFEERIRDNFSKLGMYFFKDVCFRITKRRVIWLLNVLLSSETALSHIDFPRLLERGASSCVDMTRLRNFPGSELVCGTSLLDVMHFMFERIAKVGGTAALKSQITATDDRMACLFITRNLKSPDVMNLVFEKIVEAGGPDLLNSQLSATDNLQYNCLQICCMSQDASPEVVKLVLEKIIEAGGAALLKSQLTVADRFGQTCLMLACIFPRSPAVVSLLFEKIVEVGGKDLLKSQLAVVDTRGFNCLMTSCCRAWAAEIVYLVLAKIIEAGGPELLKSNLSLKDNTDTTCLTFALFNDVCPEVAKVLAVLLFELDLFRQYHQQQDAEPDDRVRERLSEKVGIENASWVPDPESVAEVKKMLKL